MNDLAIPKDIPSRTLDETAIEDIADAYDAIRLDDAFRARVQDIAQQYWGWMEHPMPPRSQARYGLELAGYLVSEGLRTRKNRTTDLEEALTSLNATARELLWRALTQVGWSREFEPLDPESWDAEDAALFVSAADLAASQIEAGDYLDHSLYLTIDELMNLFEAAAGETPTWFARKLAADEKPGSEIAGSPCGRMILAFFRHVDPDLPLTRPSNILRRICRYRAGKEPAKI